MLFTYTELSPAEYKEKHMVLTLNLIDTDHHKDYAVEILQQYGKVYLRTLHYTISLLMCDGAVLK